MNLIYDRTAEDVERALALAKKAEAGTLTDAEKTEWLAGMKGCYNATDLNRVEAAVKQLASALTSAGYPAAVTPVLKGSSRLPAGYTELEYIQSSGTQYIDTGVVPSTALITEITFACESNGIAENAIFGSAWSVSGYFFMVYSGINGFRWHSCGGYADAVVSDVTAKHNAICQKGKLTLDGVEYTLSASGSDSTNAVRLFGVTSNEGYTGAANGIYKLYRCKMHNGNTVYRDFIPCKNPSGTVGLYDTVNGTFYGNSGAGVFTAGAEISALEDREWRESDIVRLSQWRQYLANVQALRDAYYTLAETGQLSDAEDKLDYVGANNIEKILADIDLLIGWMKSSYRRCGTFQAGNNAAHLPLKGSA